MSARDPAEPGRGRRVAPVEEVECRLEVDGRALHVFRCTPDAYAELAAGWLVAEGLLAPEPAELPRLVVEATRGGAVVRFETGRDVRSFVAGTFTLRVDAGARATPPADFADAFRELYARARRYHDTGGIHAAALVDDVGRVVAHAEDVGRHNAVDKAIGAALLAGHGPARCGLVTTARVSGEMARKAANSGLGWIASRSVPTTLALAIARRARLTIVARAASAEARAWTPDDPEPTPEERPLGVILAGGRNTRFGGRPKALEKVGGRRIIDRVIEALRPLCAEVVLIANDPASCASVALATRPDAVAAAGPVSGVREALAWASERGSPGALVVACDMPFVSTSLLAALWRASRDADGAVPESDGPRGVEPLCAAYRTSCLAAIERALARDDRRVIGFFDEAGIVRMAAAEVASHGDPARMFFNVNTPAELERAHEFEAQRSLLAPHTTAPPDAAPIERGTP